MGEPLTQPHQEKQTTLRRIMAANGSLVSCLVARDAEFVGQTQAHVFIDRMVSRNMQMVHMRN